MHESILPNPQRGAVDADVLTDRMRGMLLIQPLCLRFGPSGTYPKNSKYYDTKNFTTHTASFNARYLFCLPFALDLCYVLLNRSLILSY